MDYVPKKNSMFSTQSDTRKFEDVLEHPYPEIIEIDTLRPGMLLHKVYELVLNRGPEI